MNHDIVQIVSFCGRRSKLGTKFLIDWMRVEVGDPSGEGVLSVTLYKDDLVIPVFGVFTDARYISEFDQLFCLWINKYRRL